MLESTVKVSPSSVLVLVLVPLVFNDDCVP